MGKPRKFPDEIKISVLNKTNGKCYICLKPLSLRNVTMDHYIPKSKGGTNEISNLFPCCKKCNQEKGTKILEYNVFVSNSNCGV